MEELRILEAPKRGRKKSDIVDNLELMTILPKMLTKMCMHPCVQASMHVTVNVVK